MGQSGIVCAHVFCVCSLLCTHCVYGVCVLCAVVYCAWVVLVCVCVDCVYVCLCALDRRVT